MLTDQLEELGKAFFSLSIKIYRSISPASAAYKNNTEKEGISRLEFNLKHGRRSALKFGNLGEGGRKQRSPL